MGHQFRYQETKHSYLTTVLVFPLFLMVYFIFFFFGCAQQQIDTRNFMYESFRSNLSNSHLVPLFPTMQTQSQAALVIFVLFYFVFPPWSKVSAGYSWCGVWAVNPTASSVPRHFVLSTNFLFLCSKEVKMSVSFLLPLFPFSLFVRVDLNVLVLLTILHLLSYIKSVCVSAFCFCSTKAA